MKIANMNGDESASEYAEISRHLADYAQAELSRHAPVGLMTIDQQGRILAHNLMLAQWRGYAPEAASGALIGDNALSWLSAESRETCLAILNAEGSEKQVFREVSVEGCTLDGDFAPILFNADLVTTAEGDRWAHVALIDATERARFERELIEARLSADRANEQLNNLQEQLRHQALHDPLTGLANQTLLEEQLSRILLSATRSERPCAAIYLDLDGFRAINRECGHVVGDKLLRNIAERLKLVTPVGGIVSRLGGDEFVLAGGPTDKTALSLLAERVLEQVRRPMRELIGDRMLSASIGAVMWAPRPGEGAPLARDFIAVADQAMYEAKRAGKNTVALCNWSDVALHEPQRT